MLVMDRYICRATSAAAASHVSRSPGLVAHPLLLLLLFLSFPLSISPFSLALLSRSFCFGFLYAIFFWVIFSWFLCFNLLLLKVIEFIFKPLLI